MPVLVTAAHQPLARRIASRLLDEGGQVRAYADGGVPGLRAAGAFVAQGAVDDEGRLEAALEQVHTLVHVGGGVLARDPGRMIRDAQVVATAASNAEVRRIIALSLPGASTDAQDPIRRAKAEVESIVAAVPCPTVVVRVSLVDTPAIRDRLATAAPHPAVLDTPVAPVRVQDLVELVVAFDQARSDAADGHLVVAADGPTVTTLRGYLDRVGVAAPGRGSLVGRRIPSGADVVHLDEVLSGPWTTDTSTEIALDGWSFAGISPGRPGP